jgi:hypothetical protein
MGREMGRETLCDRRWCRCILQLHKVENIVKEVYNLKLIMKKKGIFKFVNT